MALGLASVQASLTLRSLLHRLSFSLPQSRLGRVQASLTLRSLLHRLSFALPQSRLGRVQASLTLRSLLHRFSRFFLIVLQSRRLSVVSSKKRLCLHKQVLLEAYRRMLAGSMQYKQGFCWFWFRLTQEFTGDPKNIKKRLFFLFFRSACTIFNFVLDRLRLGKSQQTSFSLLFHSACTIFNFVLDRLRLGKSQKNFVFLAFPLGLHYLCPQI